MAMLLRSRLSQLTPIIPMAFLWVRTISKTSLLVFWAYTFLQNGLRLVTFCIMYFTVLEFWLSNTTDMSPSFDGEISFQFLVFPVRMSLSCCMESSAMSLPVCVITAIASTATGTQYVLRWLASRNLRRSYVISVAVMYTPRVRFMIESSMAFSST